MLLLLLLLKVFFRQFLLYLNGSSRLRDLLLVWMLLLLRLGSLHLHLGNWSQLSLHVRDVRLNVRHRRWRLELMLLLLLLELGLLHRLGRVGDLGHRHWPRFGLERALHGNWLDRCSGCGRCGGCGSCFLFDTGRQHIGREIWCWVTGRNRHGGRFRDEGGLSGYYLVSGSFWRCLGRLMWFGCYGCACCYDCWSSADDLHCRRIS